MGQGGGYTADNAMQQ
jgi:hypothetical protein